MAGEVASLPPLKVINLVELSPVTISVARTPRRSEFGLSVVLSATVPWDDATATFIASLEQVLRGLPVAPHSFLELTPEMRIHFVEGIYLADKHRIITPVRSLEIILMVPPALGCRLWDELPSVNDGPSLDAVKSHELGPTPSVENIPQTF